jgi:hypothetical protein
LGWARAFRSKTVQDTSAIGTCSHRNASSWVFHGRLGSNAPEVRSGFVGCAILAGCLLMIGVDEEWNSMTVPEPPSPGTISNDGQQSGLWLWHGEAPPPPAPPVPPPSRIERTVKAVVSAARSAGWMAPPSGMAGIALAAWAALHFLPGGQSMPTASPRPALSLALRRQPIPAPPAVVTGVALEPVHAPSAPLAKAMGKPTQHKTVKWRASRRPQVIVRRPHVWFDHRLTPVFLQHCPYQCSWAEAMRGGNY